MPYSSRCESFKERRKCGISGELKSFPQHLKVCHRNILNLVHQKRNSAAPKSAAHFSSSEGNSPRDAIADAFFWCHFISFLHQLCPSWKAFSPTCADAVVAAVAQTSRGNKLTLLDKSPAHTDAEQLRVRVHMLHSAHHIDLTFLTTASVSRAVSSARVGSGGKGAVFWRSL